MTASVNRFIQAIFFRFNAEHKALKNYCNIKKQNKHEGEK